MADSDALIAEGSRRVAVEELQNMFENALPEGMWQAAKKDAGWKVSPVAVITKLLYEHLMDSLRIEIGRRNRRRVFERYAERSGLHHALYQQANDLAVILSRKLFTRSWTEERLNDITAQVLWEFGNDTRDEEGK